MASVMNGRFILTTTSRAVKQSVRLLGTTSGSVRFVNFSIILSRYVGSCWLNNGLPSCVSFDYRLPVGRSATSEQQAMGRRGRSGPGHSGGGGRRRLQPLQEAAHALRRRRVPRTESRSR